MYKRIPQISRATGNRAAGFERGPYRIELFDPRYPVGTFLYIWRNSPDISLEGTIGKFGMDIKRDGSWITGRIPEPVLAEIYLLIRGVFGNQAVEPLLDYLMETVPELSTLLSHMNGEDPWHTNQA